jgi:hypothetical protein
MALDPLGISLRRQQTYYALGAGVELGAGWSWNGERRGAHFEEEIGGNAITLSVRTDVEWRPA